MSEENINYMPVNSEEPSEKPSLLPGFKDICMRIGAVMIVVFVSRILCNVLGAVFISVVWKNEVPDKPVVTSLVNLAFSLIFLYIVPMTAAAFLLRHPLKNSANKPFSKPKYIGRAMALFPAGYGVAIIVRLLTMIIGNLFEGTSVGDSFHVTEEIFATPDMASAVVLFVQAAIIAPVFEELWFRGMMMESLRPYGNGFAIFVSALLFGMTHANLEQFFYATAIGIFLGYIAISTRSIITTMIMHSMFNSIAGVMVLLTVDKGVGDYLLAVSKGENGVVTIGVVFFFVWMSFIVLLLVVGIFMAIYKFIKIKKYKVPKVQTELSSGKRWVVFLTRVTVIVTIIFAADAFAGNNIAQWIIEFGS